MFTVTICHCSDSIIKMYSYTLCHTLLTLCVCVCVMDKGRGWWEKEQINYRDRAADEEKGLLTFTPSFHSIVSLLHSSPPCPDLPFPSFIPFMFSLSFPFLFVSTPEPPPHDRSTPFPPSITSFFFLVPCDHKTYRNISEFQTFQPPSSSNSIHIFSFPSPLHCVPSWFANFLIFCTAPPFLNNPFFQSSLILSLFFHSFPLFLIPLTSLLLLFLLLFLLFSTISYLSLNLLHHLLVLLWSFFFFHSSLSLQPVMSFLLLMILPLFHHPSSLVSSSYTLSFINNLLSRAPVYFPHPQKKKPPCTQTPLVSSLLTFAAELSAGLAPPSSVKSGAVGTETGSRGDRALPACPREAVFTWGFERPAAVKERGERVQRCDHRKKSACEWSSAI